MIHLENQVKNSNLIEFNSLKCKSRILRLSLKKNGPHSGGRIYFIMLINSTTNQPINYLTNQLFPVSGLSTFAEASVDAVLRAGSSCDLRSWLCPCDL